MKIQRNKITPMLIKDCSELAYRNGKCCTGDFMRQFGVSYLTSVEVMEILFEKGVVTAIDGTYYKFNPDSVILTDTPAPNIGSGQVKEKE